MDKAPIDFELYAECCQLTQQSREKFCNWIGTRVVPKLNWYAGEKRI